MKNSILLLFALLMSATLAFAQPYAYVPNTEGGDVSVVDLSTNTVATTITTGTSPFCVATDAATRKVYVTNQTGSSVSVIDANTNTVETTFAVGTTVTGIALSPDGTRLYVASFGENNLRVINTSDNATVATINTGDRPFGVAVTPDGAKVLVSNNGGNTVTVIDAVTNVVSATVSVGIDPQAIVLNTAVTKAYVANSGSNNVSVIDLATNMVSNTIGVGGFPRGLDIGGAGFDKLYVANDTEGSISVIDLNTEMVENTISVAGGMVGVDVSADGSTVYVANRSTNLLYLVDAATNTSTANVTVGSSPRAYGNFILNGSPSSPTDDCEEATDLSPLFGQAVNEPQVSTLFDNTAFTTDENDPAVVAGCFFEDDAFDNTGWFSFTGDGNTYRVRSVQCTGPDENLDLQVAVYSGTCGNLTDVACNEDEDGNNGIFNFNVEFDTEEGVEYLILVDGYQGATGEFCIEVTNITEPLPGDQCDIAIDINSLFGQAEMVVQLSETYDNTGYNPSPGDMPGQNDCSFLISTGNFGSSLQPFWFAFTGDGNRYTINSTGDLLLVGTLFTGDCGNLTEVDCDGNFSGNFSLDFQTEAGVDYLLIVSRSEGNTGEFNLEVTNQGSVGVQDIRHTAFNVYPNPTNGWVQLDGFTADQIEVLDQLGRTVRTQGQAGNGVDLSGLPAGVYVLRMQAGTEVYSAKVVKE